MRLGEKFSWNLVMFGPKQSVGRRDHVVLLNALFAQAKMAMAVTEKYDRRVWNNRTSVALKKCLCPHG